MVLKRLFKNNKSAADYSVMVIDDDPSTSLLIVGLLEDEGYTVHVAHNGGEALKLLSQIPLPDVFVIDLIMPDMDGKEFIEKARVRLGRSMFPPSLLLTAASNGESIANDIEVSDFLPKPFQGDDLVRHIRELAERTN